MADQKHEPQSYGSQGEWERGEVGEQVTRLKGRPDARHADFYESRHDSDDTSPGEGGFTSAVQVNDVEHAPWYGATASEDEYEWKVTGLPSGAKRGSYFKSRDYK